MPEIENMPKRNKLLALESKSFALGVAIMSIVIGGTFSYLKPTIGVPMLVILFCISCLLIWKAFQKTSVIIPSLIIITSVVGLWIWQKYWPQPQAEQTQWYLKFKGTDVFPDYDENGDPIEMPFRVISIINGQRYSYPTDLVLIRQGIKIEDSFPIPTNIKPPYRIKFEGILIRGDKQVPLKSTKEDVYQTYQLPIEKCEYEVFADSSLAANPNASKFVVHYEIINYQEKSK